MFNQLQQKIEWHVLELIKELSKIGKLPKEQAQRMAKHVLDCIKPDMTPEEFFKGVFKIDDGFPELSFIVVPLARYYKEKIEDPSTDYVRNLIKSARYDEAVDITKKLVAHDIKLKLVGRGKAK